MWACTIMVAYGGLHWFSCIISFGGLLLFAVDAWMVLAFMSRRSCASWLGCTCCDGSALQRGASVVHGEQSSCFAAIAQCATLWWYFHGWYMVGYSVKRALYHLLWFHAVAVDKWMALDAA